VPNWRPPEISPWRRRALTIPPDSLAAWVRLGVWEFWMGSLLYVAIGFGTQLLAAAPHSIVTVFDFSNCYASPPVVLPCERVAYRAGALNATLNVWCGVLLIGVAGWMLWDLWNATTPKPITDDFLKLLDDSFGRDWRKPRSWPWARLGWAYGFTLVGLTSALCVGLLLSAAISSSTTPKAPTVETSQSFRLGP
jgi:hypothetical protein